MPCFPLLVDHGRSQVPPFADSSATSSPSRYARARRSHKPATCCGIISVRQPGNSKRFTSATSRHHHHDRSMLERLGLATPERGTSLQSHWIRSSVRDTARIHRRAFDISPIDVPLRNTTASRRSHHAMGRLPHPRNCPAHHVRVSLIARPALLTGCSAGVFGPSFGDPTIPFMG